MDYAVVDAGIGWSGNVAHRERREVLYVASHRRVTGALRGDETERALRWMAGWVRAIVVRGRIQAVGGRGTADVERGLPERPRGRHAEPGACNQGLEREQAGYAGHEKTA